MTAPYRLHYAPDNASICVRLALEEMGLPYDTVLVDRRARQQKSPAHLKLNPNGLIPVLETPDGAMFETGAILLWLADRHGQLAPPTGDPERAAVLTWLFWLSNTLHPALRMLFYPEQHTLLAIRELRDVTKTRIARQLALLDQAPTGWLDRPSVLSCYAAPMLRWLALYPQGQTEWFDLSAYPRLHNMALMMEDRPSAQAAMAAEGLGVTPFSAPTYPNPPEGSAL